MESEPGSGTTFRVVFPALSSRTPPQSSEGPAVPASRGSGTVLVVDDEEIARSAVQHMLETTGFDVITAPDGPAGIRAFQEGANQIVAVLLDMTMPRLSGGETLRALRRLRADIPVILSSGYDEPDTIDSRCVEQGRIAFLQKPYSLNTLIAKLQDVTSD